MSHAYNLRSADNFEGKIADAGAAESHADEQLASSVSDVELSSERVNH